MHAQVIANSMEIVFDIKAGIYELLVNNIPKISRNTMKCITESSKAAFPGMP